MSAHKIFIDGPVGRLEAMISDVSARQVPITGIICHPHPLHGGTMNNKVVTTLSRVFSELGLATIRFNYRGVEGSEGEYADAIGEAEDLLTVIEWAKTNQTPQAIWLAGFSFGSFVAYQQAHHPLVKQLICVAPPVHHFAFNDLPEPTCSWVIVQGEADEVVLADYVYHWHSQLQTNPTLLRFEDAGHFFYGKLIELREQLIKTLQPRVPE